MRKYLIALTTILLLLGTALTTTATAQTDTSIEKVILASTENYPDALIASAPASKLGIPVLLTNKDQIPEETRSSLENYAPSEIILVGGPAVISEQVEVGLEEKGYQVTRLWGTSRYGTANEVAEHFWLEGSKRALVVQNNFESDSELLAQAKELARQQEIPLFLVPEDKVPAEVLAQMNELGVEQVTAVGPNTDVIEQAITEVSMQIERTFNGSQQQIRQRIREQVRENLTSQTELVVVAAGNFGHTIAAPNLPNSTSFIVSSAEEIEEAITAIAERNITEVKVVGKPELASQIAEQLEQETEATVNLVSGKGKGQAQQAIGLAHNLTAREQVRTRLREQAERKIRQWKQKVERKMERIGDRANKSLIKAKLMAGNMGDKAQSLLKQANSSCLQGNWSQCREKAEKAMSEAREKEWKQIKDKGKQIRDRIRQETKSLQEKVEEMREMNQEFGEMMQENMSVKERLKVVNKFKNQHRQQVRRIIEQATQHAEQGVKRGLKAIESAMKGLRQGKGLGNNPSNQDNNKSQNNNPSNPPTPPLPPTN